MSGIGREDKLFKKYEEFFKGIFIDGKFDKNVNEGCIMFEGSSRRERMILSTIASINENDFIGSVFIIVNIEGHNMFRGSDR